MSADNANFDTAVVTQLESRGEPCWPSDVMEAINASRNVMFKRPCAVRDVRQALDRLEKQRRVSKDDQGLWSVRA